MAQSKIDIVELRYWIYIATLVLFFSIWFARLFSLQILQGATYASEAAQIAERSERLSAKRGIIYYNDGQTPIVDNRDVFTVYLTPGRVPEGQLANELQLLEQILEMNNLAAKMEGRRNLLQPIELKENVQIEVIQKIAERRDRLIGVSYTSHPERNLRGDGSIIHVVGYVGKISDHELEVRYNNQYQVNTKIGKMGIERYYDNILRGYDGSRIQVVSAKGDVLDERIEPPKSGASLTLSIDRRIQKLAEGALGDKVGSAIVLRPATGEILAMVSTPWYRLSDFHSSESFQALIRDPRKPMINRAIQSQYPPASTFKMVVATAMLGERSFPPSKRILDRGYWQLGNRLFRSWLREGHGYVNLVEAIAYSSNVYFGIVGVQYVGEPNITKYARKYGLGHLTGVDLLGEVGGFVPSPEWKYQSHGEVWTKGDTLNISIGQGFMLVTPLQVAVYISAIVNDGIAYRPSLLRQIHDKHGQAENVAEPEVLYDMNLDASIFWQLRYGMRQAVLRGTARATVYNGVVAVAAKTGTGETGLDNSWHSWFASYAPYETSDPLKRVVVVTQVEADPSEENYTWWAPRAADIIYRGIFAAETYEEVWRNYKQRRVWFHPMMKVPAGAS